METEVGVEAYLSHLKVLKQGDFQSQSAFGA